MSYKLPSNIIRLSQIFEILCYIDKKKNASIDEISNYSNIGSTYATYGLNTLRMLGVLEKDEKDFIISEEVKRELLKVANKNDYKDIMKKLLVKWNPFITFVTFLELGYLPVESSKKVYTMYDFKGKDHIFLLKMFVQWGNELDVLVTHGDSKITTNEEIRRKFEDMDKLAISCDEIANRMYILKILGEEAFKFLQVEEVDLLINGMSEIESDPDNSIHKIGKAFEDFCRDIGNLTSVNLKAKNGITQIVSALYSNGDSNSKICSKHQDIGAAISSIRNMSGHSQEANSGKIWSLSSDGARAYLGIVLVAMKSIYLHTKQNMYYF